MSNLNDFNREAKAALRVALQWLLLAVPTGLACGVVGTAFHLSVEYVTELRAAQPWLLLCLPLAGLAIVALYKVTKCEGVGTNNVIRAVQSGEPVSILLVPAIFLGTVLTHLCGGFCRPRGCSPADGRQHWLERGKTAASERLRPPHSHHQRDGSVLLCPVRHPADRCPVCHDGGGRGADVHFGFYARVHFGPHCLRRIPVLRDRPDQFCAQFHPAPDAGNRASDRPAGHCLCRRDPAVLLDASHPRTPGIPKRIPNPWLRAFAGGAAVVAFSYLFGVGRYNGAGMAVIADAVEQGAALPWDFLCKIFLTALTLAVGFKGGEVVPSFYIGATFGCVAGPRLGLPAGFAGAIGLVCVFCGATNALIPSILLGFELFGGQGLELIALGCGVCYMLSGPPRPLQQPDLCHQQAAAGVRLPQVAGQAEEKRRMIFRRFSPRRA